MKDYFHTQNKVLSGVEDLGKIVGVNPATSNPMNALKSLTKCVNRLMSAEEKVQEMGYTSLEIALKALSQFKKESSTLPEDFPEHFGKVPQIWGLGRVPTRKTPGFAPIPVRTAIRRHKMLLPLLAEAWVLSEEEGRDQLVRRYLSSSPDEFEQELYEFIYEIEGDTLEEQLIDEVQRKVEEERFQDWSFENSMSRAKKS